MILPDAEVAALKSALRCWEWFGYISTAVVGLGCIGEFIAEFTSVSKCEQCKHKIAKLSLIILIVGIAGELLSAARTSQLSGQIIANIEERAAHADQEAGGALWEQEKLKSENLRLESQIAPRRLDLNQQLKIAENCSKFKNLFRGKRVKLVSYSLDTEAFVLAEQVVGALRMKPCEMTVDDEAMSITPMMGTLIMGIQVFGSNSELAKEIANAIGSSGKPVAISFVGTDPTSGAMRVETPNSRIAHEATVLVGLKPFDPDTVTELKRIMGPTAKAAKR